MSEIIINLMGQMNYAFISERIGMNKSIFEEFFPNKWDMWQDRYPRFGAYRCALCPKVILASGACYDCVRVKQILYFNTNGHIVIRVDGKIIPYHRFIFDKPFIGGHDVHHVDFNKWNNRLSNLIQLPHQDHFSLHNAH